MWMRCRANHLSHFLKFVFCLICFQPISQALLSNVAYWSNHLIRGNGNKTDFWALTCILLSSFNRSGTFLWIPWDFLCSKSCHLWIGSVSFLHFYSICFLIPFQMSYHIARTFRTMLISSGESGQLRLVSDLEGGGIHFYTTNYSFSCGLFCRCPLIDWKTF